MSAIEAIVRLAAELPDPGHPSFTTICAGLGGFGTGLVCWLVALAIDRL